MRTLCFGLKVADFAELEHLSFTAVFLYLQQADEYFKEAKGIAEKNKRRREW